MQKKETLFFATIPEKLAFLKQYDKNFQVFGSQRHRYLCNPPLEETEVAAWEQKYQVQLPKAYRDFIKTIGDGGAGPGYGLFPLYKALESSYLQKPFVLESDFVVERSFDTGAYACEIGTCDENCTLCENAENCLLYWDDTENCFRYEQGALRLNSHGCTYYDVLVCKGVGVGSVWAANEANGMIALDIDFLQWYEYWLDDCIDTIYPFVEAYHNKIAFSQFMEIQGSGLFDFERTKLCFLCGLLGVSVSNKMKIKTVQKAYEKWQKKP